MIFSSSFLQLVFNPYLFFIKPVSFIMVTWYFSLRPYQVDDLVSNLESIGRTKLTAFPTHQRTPATISTEHARSHLWAYTSRNPPVASSGHILRLERDGRMLGQDDSIGNCASCTRY